MVPYGNNNRRSALLRPFRLLPSDGAPYRPARTSESWIHFPFQVKNEPNAGWHLNCNPKTAEDHKKLAAYYRDKAQEAK